MSDLYPKIPGPFTRHVDGPNRNKVIFGSWTSSELAALADYPGWIWTEKVDGTNIRVNWDGHKVTFGGRTDNAQIPAKLIQNLVETFTEELLEQAFQDTPAILYGEGYGAGIQKGGGDYGPVQSFILFDVRIGDWWLLREAATDIARQFAIPTVPFILKGSINTALRFVSNGFESQWENKSPEGLVGITDLGLRNRKGDRLIVKIKGEDFRG